MRLSGDTFFNNIIKFIIIVEILFAGDILFETFLYSGRKDCIFV